MMMMINTPMIKENATRNCQKRKGVVCISSDAWGGWLEYECF